LKTITIGHSPDADDIFMYYAIAFGWVGINGLELKNIALDIETLNKKAIKNELDISAISFGLYPHIKDNYALLKTAVSFGEGYGPKLVKKRNKILKPNFKVALSGEYTTNAMLFKIAYPKARIKYMNFLEIENAILNDEVDAGVLIHESILTFSDDLVVQKEIWDIWCELSKDNLPLPLGGMALRRSIPLLFAIDLEELLILGVKVANSNRAILSRMLLERNLVRVDNVTLEKYLNLYANDNSIILSDIQIKAINRLFEIGYSHGFYHQLIKAEECFIPSEYKKLRFS